MKIREIEIIPTVNINASLFILILFTSISPKISLIIYKIDRYVFNIFENDPYSGYYNSIYFPSFHI